MADLNTSRGNARAQVRRSAIPGVVTEAILPTLMLSHGIRADVPPRVYPNGITQEDIALFCNLVDIGNGRQISLAITKLRARGISTDELMLGLLPAVAQDLGRRWVSDECDFVSVTIALGHLQQMRREIGRLPDHTFVPAGVPKKALLAPTPGDQHNFGIMIVDHFLHQAGWDVTTMPVANADDLVGRAARESFEIAGLSLSCEAYLLTLEKTIATIRRTSKNRDIGILVGGRLFLEKPDLAVLIGADATAIDGRDAVLQAERIAVGTSCLQTMDH